MTDLLGDPSPTTARRPATGAAPGATACRRPWASTTAATATATSTPRAGAGHRQPGRRALGPHHVRLLLGGLRDARRRARRGGRRGAGRPGPPREPGPAVPQGPVRAPDDHRRRAASPPRSVDGRAGDVGRRARPRRRTASGPSSTSTGPRSVAVLSTGQLVTEEFYALGKLVRLGMGLAHYDGNTTLCMASAVSGYKLSFGTDGPPGLLRRPGRGRRARAVGRQHRRQPPAARAPGAGRPGPTRPWSWSTPG